MDPVRILYGTALAAILVVSLLWARRRKGSKIAATPSDEGGFESLSDARRRLEPSDFSRIPAFLILAAIAALCLLAGGEFLDASLGLRLRVAASLFIVGTFVILSFRHEGEGR